MRPRHTHAPLRRHTGGPTMSNADLDSNAPIDLLAGSWEDVTQINVVGEELEKAATGDATSKGGVNQAITDGGVGVVLPLITNPDGSHSFTGNRNVDAVLIGSKWGSLNLTYSFPGSGADYNGAGYDSNGV